MTKAAENDRALVQGSEQGRYGRYSEVLSKCYSAVFQDILDSIGFRNQCMHHDIKPLSPSMKTWGEAITIRMEEVDGIPEKPYQVEMELIDEALPGQLIVGECPQARQFSSFWGGLLSNAALGHGIRGVVVEGKIRDSLEILELGFPAFSTGLTPYDSLGRMDGVEKNIPVKCGGVDVKPGDLVFGDNDGVVVIPFEMADDVIEKAAEKVRGESMVRDVLRSGASVVETFRKYGIL